MTKSNNRDVERRTDELAKKLDTKIWQEISANHNPYISERSLCRGYDLFDLMRQRSYVEVLFLLFRGELPDKKSCDLFEALLIALINPGPRHSATRAAINAGAGKSDPAHILPIALGVMGGRYMGGGEVEDSMRFIRSHLRKEPADTVNALVERSEVVQEGDWHPAPGFGTRFGSIDIQACRLAGYLAGMEGAGVALAWGSSFDMHLKEYGYGWLSPGIVAATLLDLGFHPRIGAGLYQILSAPGLLAHGIEYFTKPLSAMPVIDKEHYIIDER